MLSISLYSPGVYYEYFHLGVISNDQVNVDNSHDYIEKRVTELMVR